MGLNDDINPWEEIERLRTENAELKSEIQATHDLLDGAGADRNVGMLEVSQGPQHLDYRLTARLIRYLLEHACPLGKVRS